ncbi:MAG: PAS domain-containing protein, partial [Methanomicrobiales archaeon]|nr:PAS domain-containing protein [Methanomicrobiales archaeon]
MVAKKSKSPEKKDAGITPPTHSLRDDAEEQLARSRKVSSDLAKQSPEELIHELQVHQIELETQAEELRKSHLELEESWDKYLDLYDFAPVGYLTLNDKALITDVNLAGAALLCVERNKLVGAPFSKFIAEKDADQWHRYFVSVLRDDKKLASTLTLIRGDGSLLPVRVESIRLAGSSEGTTTVRVAISDITDIWQ